MENSSSESSDDDEIEQMSLTNSPKNIVDDDDYLDKLAQWQPNQFSTPSIESDNEEDNIHVDLVETLPEIPSNEVEDLLVTFVQYPVKTEPVIYDNNNLNIPQLDGQNDFLQKNRNKTSKYFQKKKSHSHQQSASSTWEHLLSPERNSDSYRKTTTDNPYLTEQKYTPLINTSIKKRKLSRSKKLFPVASNGKTILDYFKVINSSSTKSPINKTKIRSDNYFDGCIVIDDDNDLQETEEQSPVQQRYTFSSDIHSREKLLNHVVHSSEMRIKWLLNVELILLEHISNYHKQTTQLTNYTDLDDSFSYHIDSKLISTIIENFLKIFLIRNFDDEQDEISFYQFSLTLYLRYLLIELPTYKHKNFNDENNCYECKQYSLLLNILFDLLFDLIEYDICEIYNKEKYRSLLIEDDYFNQLKIIKKNPFNRIKLIIYFIELIEIHRNKCLNKKEDYFLQIQNRIYQWIENFIRYIIYQINNLNNERLSICFDIIELCLLFIHEKENYIKQISVFLIELCKENSNYIHRFLFDENLLPDIRLLITNELIWNKFNIKFQSIDYLEEFFQQIQDSLKSVNSIDDMALLLIRSLFNSYADLIIDLKKSMLIYPIFSERIITVFRDQFESIYLVLMNLSQDSNSSRELKRTVILLYLLKCKWNRL